MAGPRPRRPLVRERSRPIRCEDRDDGTNGRLSLTEDIRKYIPELPDYGHKITLDHLMTHTSGIRDWTGLRPLTERNIDALTVTLRQRGVNFAPGEEFAYSNGGYVLLKEIVARTSGLSFGEFTRKRIFEPLGMKNTVYLADLRTVVKNRALAYDKAGSEWKLEMRLDNDRGGGGALLSTASDLLIWNDALTNARLGDFVTGKLQEPAKLSNGRKLGYLVACFWTPTAAAASSGIPAEPLVTDHSWSASRNTGSPSQACAMPARPLLAERTRAASTTCSCP